MGSDLVAAAGMFALAQLYVVRHLCGGTDGTNGLAGGDQHRARTEPTSALL